MKRWIFSKSHKASTQRTNQQLYSITLSVTDDFSSYDWSARIHYGWVNQTFCRPVSSIDHVRQGHYLWNAGKVISNYIEDHAEQLVKGKTVLELGAGAGLPSITASLHGATTVVATDYPDGDLIENLQINVTARHTVLPKGDMHAAGHLWGADPSELFSYLPPQDSSKVFDVLILADLLFNHSEHAKLLQTLSRTLKRTSEARALVFFTPYRPWLLDKDLAFFDLAAKAGFVVTKILESVMEKVMFEEDPGVSYIVSDMVACLPSTCVLIVSPIG